MSVSIRTLLSSHRLLSLPSCTVGYRVCTASLKEFASMDADGVRQLATLADEAALDADDMHDIASTLRGHVAERGDDVDQLLEAFEYVHQPGEGRGRFIPAMQMGDRVYPPPLKRVPQETLAIWAEVTDYAEQPAVRARLQDLLFLRRIDNGRDRASAAADPYMELSRLWPPIQTAMELLPRALDLSHRLGLTTRANTACSLALDLAAEQLDQPQPRPGVPLRLLRATIEAGCDDPRIDEVLQRVREVLPTLWDTKSTIELQLRRAAGDERHQLNRQLILGHLEEAEQHAGMKRASLLQDAAELARDRQLPDLHERAIRQLQQLSADDLELQTIETEINVSVEEIRKVFEAYLDANAWREALDRFAFLQVPTGATEHNPQQVTDQQQDTPFLSMVSTVIYDTDACPSTVPVPRRSGSSTTSSVPRPSICSFGRTSEPTSCVSYPDASALRLSATLRAGCRKALMSARTSRAASVARSSISGQANTRPRWVWESHSSRRWRGSCSFRPMPRSTNSSGGRHPANTQGSPSSLRHWRVWGFPRPSRAI